MALSPVGRVRVKVIGGRGSRGLEGPEGPQGRDVLDLAVNDEFNGLEGQTTFVTEEAFSPAIVDVWINGVLMSRSGFTVTDQNTIVLNAPLKDDAIVAVRAFQTPAGRQPVGIDKTLAELRAAPISNVARYFDGSWWTWTAGNYTGQIDDKWIVKANSQAVTAGAWVRQGADKIAYRQPNTGGQAQSVARAIDDLGSVLRFIPDDLIPAIKAGTSNAPIADYVQKAYDQGTTTEIWWPGGRYFVEKEIDTRGRRTMGSGWNNTRIIAGTAGQRSVFLLRGQNNLIEALHIDATLARTGITCFTSNGSTIRHVGIDDARVAGIELLETGNNSEMMLADNTIRRCGKAEACGTTTAAAGVSTVTITGADPTTKNISIPYDFVSIAGEPAREITAFTSTTISFFPPLDASKSNAAVRILSGANIRIGRNGDNSDIKSHNNTLQNAPLFGIDCHALYGVQSLGDTAELNGYAFGVGRRAAAGEQAPINTRIQQCYSEVNYEGAVVYHGSSFDFVFEQPVIDGVGNFGLDGLRVADPNTLRGSRISINGNSGGRRNLANLNAGNNQDVYVGNSVIIAAAGNVTVTLIQPVITAGVTGMNGTIAASLFDLPATVILEDINGGTATFRSTTSINGVAPSGTYATKAYTGNYRKVEARWHYQRGWILTASPIA